MEKNEKYNYIIVPLNISGVITSYVKDDENVDKSEYDKIMTELISKVTTHSKMGEILHNTMIEFSKLVGSICEEDSEKFKNIIPSFMSLVPQCWYPEVDEEKRKLIMSFSENLRNEMEQACQQPTS